MASSSSRLPASGLDGTRPRIFAFDDFEFDEERWELRARGTALDVQGKVMQTIGLLIRNRERVVPTEELLQSLWGDVTVTESSLLKAIRLARKVLGDDGDSQRFIRTTRGRGYRFVAEVKELTTRAHERDAGTRASDSPEEHLLGRETELAELTGALDRAIGGRGTTFLVSGDAGIGKTRLAERFGALASARGARVCWGRASEAGGAPELWPWIQVVRALVNPEDLPSQPLGTVLRLAGTVGDVDDATMAPLFRSEAQRFRFFDGISGVLRRAATARPLVVILEDLHATDRASLDLARFLARGLVDSGVVLLGTYRPGEVSSGPGADALAGVLRDARGLTLSGLTTDATGRLLEAALGAPAPATAVLRIHQATEGNPLFVSEIAQSAVSGGLGMAGLAAIEIPERIVAVVRGRLEGLPTATAELLGVAAVIGRDFALSLLERVSGLAGPEILGALQPALDRRVVVPIPESPGACRFGHALLRDVSYEALGLARRAELHLAVGEALERTGPVDPEAALLAHHFIRSTLGGGSQRAARYALLAGEQALRAFAFEDARRHLDDALGALRFEADQDELRADILTVEGHAERLTGDYAGARRTFSRAIELARNLGDARRAARAALGFAEVSPETGSANSIVIALLEEVRSTLEGQDAVPPDDDARELVALTLARIATCLSFAGRAVEAQELAQRALSLARAVGRLPTLGRALWARHWGLWGPGTAPERLSIAREMVALAERGHDDSLLTEARICEVTDLLELGRRKAFDGAVVEFERAARAVCDSNALYTVMVFETTQAMMEGRFEEAEQAAGRAFPVGSRIFEDNARNFFGAAISWIRFEQGRAKEVESAFRAAVDAEPSNALLRSVLARILAESDRRDAARAELELPSLADLAALPRDWAFLPTLTHLSIVAELIGDAALARRLEARLAEYDGTHVVVGPAVVYLGPVALSLGLCALVSSEHDAAVERLERALAESHVARAQPAAARAEYHLAEALARRGRPGDAERAERAAASALSTCSTLGMAVLGRRATALVERLQRR